MERYIREECGGGGGRGGLNICLQEGHIPLS